MTLNSYPRPKVSVTIPTYNYGHYIGQAIQSVLGQTFKDFELIVVDNCSSDNTEEVVKGFRDNRLSYHRNSCNLGFVGNLNRCIELSKGQYLSILHADDIYLPRILEIESGILDAYPEVGLVYSALHTIDNSGRVIDLWRPFDEDHIWDGLEEFKHNVLVNYIQFPTIMVRRRSFQTVGGFDTELLYGPDWDMWLRIELSGYQVAYLAMPLSHYRLHSESETSWFLKAGQRFTEDYKVLRKVFSSKEAHDLIPREELSSIKKRALERLVNGEVDSALRQLRDGHLRQAWLQVASVLSDRSILEGWQTPRPLTLLALRFLQLLKDSWVRRLSRALRS